MCIAVIPARGGSKRIPRKNIRNFLGKPVIAYSIAAAKSSGIFKKVVVSTDNDEIASVAKMYGAEVPFVRSSRLSDDYATTADVMKDAVQRMLVLSPQSEYFCCIYATAPFVTAEMIQRGYSFVTSGDWDYAFSATSFGFPIQRAFGILPSGGVLMFQPEHNLTRSQDLPQAYHDAGQFYWGSKSAWLTQKPIFSSSSMPVVLPRKEVQDIDTEEDWELAEILHRYRYQSS